jgi:hypothetical protein
VIALLALLWIILSLSVGVPVLVLAYGLWVTKDITGPRTSE